MAEDMYKIETIDGEPVKKEYTYSQLQKVMWFQITNL